ncbi:MAG: NINE protein [Bacteroidota bacterium]
MKKIFTFLVLTLFSVSLSFASSYTLDNKKVDNLFDSAIEISLTDLVSDEANLPSDVKMITQDDLTSKVLVAWIVDWVGLGFFGIHRYVLGTKPNMWALYTFTCGGIFGIVPIVDWFVLLIDGLINQNAEQYIDNENFFMWG